MIKQTLFAIKCRLCQKEFIYCIKSGKDFRCYDCKAGTSVESVQKEISEMSKEEYQLFMDDIEEFEKNLKKSKKI